MASKPQDLVAALIPSRTAARVDPLVAIRCE
jgi:ABC-type lipoprotein release transport system permease subunit